jgi:plasmid maintenance system antidote protein VapI
LAAQATALALRILKEAIGEQSSLGVEMVIILGSVFGVTEEFVEPLSLLVVQDWHKAMAVHFQPRPSKAVTDGASPIRDLRTT